MLGATDMIKSDFEPKCIKTKFAIRHCIKTIRHV